MVERGNKMVNHREKNRVLKASFRLLCARHGLGCRLQLQLQRALSRAQTKSRLEWRLGRLSPGETDFWGRRCPPCGRWVLEGWILDIEYLRGLDSYPRHFYDSFAKMYPLAHLVTIAIARSEGAVTQAS